jgi:hypothetical protein
MERLKWPYDPSLTNGLIRATIRAPSQWLYSTRLALVDAVCKYVNYYRASRTIRHSIPLSKTARYMTACYMTGIPCFSGRYLEVCYRLWKSKAKQTSPSFVPNLHFDEATFLFSSPLLCMRGADKKHLVGTANNLHSRQELPDTCCNCIFQISPLICLPACKRKEQKDLLACRCPFKMLHPFPCI